MLTTTKWDTGALGVEARCAYKGTLISTGSPSLPPKGHFPYSEASHGTFWVQALLAEPCSLPG